MGGVDGLKMVDCELLTQLIIEVGDSDSFSLKGQGHVMSSFELLLSKYSRNVFLKLLSKR